MTGDAARDAARDAAGKTAVVVGGGISGLLAARELARAGVSTTVLEATGAWGGCVGSHVVAGLTLDSGAESFATRSSAVGSRETVAREYRTWAPMDTCRATGQSRPAPTLNPNALLLVGVSGVPVTVTASKG